VISSGIRQPPVGRLPFYELRDFLIATKPVVFTV
jgi:hypothetical protein